MAKQKSKPKSVSKTAMKPAAKNGMKSAAKAVTKTAAKSGKPKTKTGALAKTASKSGSSKGKTSGSGAKGVLKAAAKKVVKAAKAVVKAAKPAPQVKAAKAIAPKTALGKNAKSAVSASAKTQAPTSEKSSSGVQSSKKLKPSDIAKVISPLDDRILVEVAAVATRTAGGLFIPDSVDASERQKQGTVVAVGRGHVGRKGKLRPLDVQLGDTVIFEPYMGSPIQVGDQELVVLRESQLLGVVKG
jgi:chaperonin GroES